MGNGAASTTPIISQCPVVVSLPAERSAMRATTPAAGSAGGTPAVPVSRPSPQEPRFGSASPPTAAAVCATVLAPSSP